MRTDKVGISNRRGFLLNGATLAGAALAPAFAAQSRESDVHGPTGTGGRDCRAAPASAPTVKSVERLAGSANSFAYAVKAGPWIFLNGHEAYDFERGLAPEVEGPPGHRLSGRPPLRREAEYILRRMRAILKEFGSDLPNAVRVDQFYTTGQAVHAYHLARFAEFGSYIPPSTSIIMERCFTARTNIHTSMLAIVPAQGWTIEKITLPGQAISASGYNPAVVVNDFVFVAGNQALRRERRSRARRGGSADAQLGRPERLPPAGALRDQGAARAFAQGRRIGARAQPQGAGLYPRRQQLPRFHGRMVAVFPRHPMRGDAGAGEGLFQHREHARDQSDRAQERRRRVESRSSRSISPRSRAMGHACAPANWCSRPG